MDEALICFGGSVKALGNGKVGGYLVRFSTFRDPDITPTRDFFTPDTDYDLEPGMKSTIYYDHGLDPVLRRRKLGKVSLKKDAVGIWVEGQLEMRDDYERAIYGMAEKGKLGWSSGTATHLVERKKVGNSNQIVRWPLGLDASLTPTPAEPRNAAMSLKSYAETATKANSNGLMVGFRLPPEIAAQLAVPGGEAAADLHITLCYCGDLGMLSETAEANATVVVEKIAKMVQPLTGTISGLGRFNASSTSGGKDVIVALVDVPGLSDLQSLVAAQLDRAGVTVRRDHGFEPHITLAKVEPGAGSPLSTLDNIPLRLEAITVFAGPEPVDLPLTGWLDTDEIVSYGAYSLCSNKSSGGSPAGLSLVAHSDAVRGAVQEYLERVSGLHSLRKAENKKKTLGESQLKALSGFIGDLERSVKAAREILSDSSSSRSEAFLLELEFELGLAQTLGVPALNA